MADTRRIGALETSEDMKFERRAWRVQRLAWVGMALFVAAGLSGLLGAGPLSSTIATAGDPRGGLEVEYDRFARVGAPKVMTIRATSRGAREVPIRIDAGWLEGVVVRSTWPIPDRIETRPDGSRVLVLLGPERATLTLELEAREAGRRAGRIGIEGGPSVPVRQLVYP